MTSTELKSKIDMNKQNNLKEANIKRNQGDSEIKTSCIICKFKPNCEDAIPFYKSAADTYHGAQAFKDEIYCLDKLAFCFHYLNSDWEEGNEYEKIAFIQLNNMDNKEAAWKAIQNAYNCYFKKAEYKDAVNSVKKLGQLYIEKKIYDYAEKCLKIAYESFLQVFHTFATKNDEPYQFLYDAFDVYVSCLILCDKTQNIIECCENVVKVTEQFEERKRNTLRIFAIQLLILFILEDENLFRLKVEEAKPLCTSGSDRRSITNIESLLEAYNQVNDNLFRECMIEINVDFPIEITKKLNSMFLQKKENKQKSAIIDNEVQILIVEENKGNEKDDYL